MKPAPHISMMPPLPFKPYGRRPLRELPFSLQEPRCRIFSLARHGLFVGVKALGLERGDEMLVSAYHHGSEVEALVRAGIVCRFYAGGSHLEPNEKELEALLGPTFGASTLPIISGFLKTLLTGMHGATSTLYC
jgi:perosamine synthetase